MTIYQIDNTRPFITVGGQAVQWQTGSAAFQGVSSLLVRVSAHGLVFKPRSWRLRSDLGLLPGWTRAPCLPSAYGLCEFNGSVCFPSAQTPVVGEGLDGLCNNPGTLRAITDGNRYDASACDVLDANVDFVLADDVLYTTTSSTLPVWVYWTVCALVVYLVRCLSRYVLASLDPKRREEINPSPVLCVLACALTTVLVTMEGDAVLVTEQDLIFYWFTVLYVCCYGALFVGTRLLVRLGALSRGDPPFYNLLAGVLLLVATRLYCGAETPYTPAIVFIIAARMLVKSRRGHDALRGITLLLDGLMVAMGSLLGFSPDPHYLIALFAAAMAAADVLVVD